MGKDIRGGDQGKRNRGINQVINVSSQSDSYDSHIIFQYFLVYIYSNIGLEITTPCM